MIRLILISIIISALSGCNAGNRSINTTDSIVIDKSFLNLIAEKPDKLLLEEYWNELLYLNYEGDSDAIEATVKMLFLYKSVEVMNTPLFEMLVNSITCRKVLKNNLVDLNVNEQAKLMVIIDYYPYPTWALEKKIYLLEKPHIVGFYQRYKKQVESELIRGHP